MSEQSTFKSLEQQGWSERAAAHDEYTARITNFGIAPLLAPGTEHLVTYHLLTEAGARRGRSRLAAYRR